jgi:hypothetical protein
VRGTGRVSGGGSTPSSSTPSSRDKWDRTPHFVARTPGPGGLRWFWNSRRSNDRPSSHQSGITPTSPYRARTEYTRPAHTTVSILRSSAIRTVGSPSTMMMSATLPVAMFT